ncbi:helix-turn-helix transcriptional regulator [Conexibacter sp. JD483]|uniref:helix-turn-helix transcriptional regulator n=1 Tax=unclassified Conexibacter TaxID=2627773 RepID=UPI002724DA66|nr:MULTISPECIES: helix-turn-helix transcriptional regulator [unclassified Conexibacter]MDO8186032.1 helix-turn-helix transcriptional regulator [Conexibacter sp. CPCC 205706]MDO8199522.1 helix-turn-helix transcriptional regulator [Conexibacter sp. CPCC 205762]MDR9368943.1 helix-turn-helix transcriptional regulator [Conexibacter sp. JD483]
MTTTKQELREFLRSRRARLAPEAVGLDRGDGHRRVPGLRREELARLAGVSVDYYVRLEQGRNASVSASVLDAIARALRLDEHERAHLFDLAKPAPQTARRRASRPQRVRPGVRLLLDTLPTPAFVLGRRLDILATNRMARALLCDFDALPPAARNHARWIFLDPATRELYVDWETIARENVAMLRLDAGANPDDQELSALIGELTIKSPEFAGWWTRHEVLRRSHGTKRYHHPVVGPLTISYEALPLPDDPDQTLFVYSAEPGSPSAEALALLGDWSL